MTDAAWHPLTAAQRGIWFAQAVEPDSTAFTTAEVIEVDGVLDAHRLREAVHEAYLAFEQLRTRFAVGPEGPRQQVMPHPAVELVEMDLRHGGVAAARSWIGEQLAIPLDPSSAAVTRTALLRVEETTSWWFHAAHHLVTDGFGFAQLARLVAANYRGDRRPATTSTVADVVSEDIGRDADHGWWDERLDSMTGSSSLSAGDARPAPAALRVTTAIDDDLQARILDAARHHGCAWTDVVTATFSAYLTRMLPSGQDPARIGVPVMDRVAPGGGVRACARTVCTMVNVLPLQIAESSLSVETFVEAIGQELATISRHGDVRQEELARGLQGRGHGRLFGPQVNVVPFDQRLDFGVGRAIVRNLTSGPVDDMTWTLRGAPGRGGPVTLEVAANPRLHDAETVSAHGERLLGWLGTVADADLARSVDNLPLLTDDESERVLVSFNDTAHNWPARTLVTAFAEQVSRTPAATALRWRGTDLSYADLATSAGRVAGALEATGTSAPVVAVALERGPDLFAAVHGIQIHGAAYLPLDPELPPARLADMIEDAGVDVVVTCRRHQDVLPTGPTRVLLDDLDAYPVSSGTPPDLDDPAYVIFTSGSTGRPKGVCVTHRAIDNRLRWMQDTFGLQPGEAVLHKTPAGFDVSVWELFWPLQVGATVVVAEPGGHRDPRYLAKLIVSEGVTTAHFVPSMLRAFVADLERTGPLTGHRLRHLVCSGEALTDADVRTTGAALGVAPWNLYGPTEAAVDVTLWQCDPDVDGSVVPIGRPVANTRCYVLDERRRPQPVGVCGELYVAGVQLAEGYVGRDDLTTAAFVPDPFVPGERMYRTGDLAQWRADGVLTYHGRADAQVKIRGQRLELGEIETVLGRVEGVEAVVVDVRPDTANDQQLVAYYVPRSSGQELGAELALAAREYLPPGLSPSRYMAMAALPLTASGKTDRRALSELVVTDTPRPQSRPRSLTEQQVCDAMSATLGRPCGPLDDFFTNGGHSLLALRLIADLEQRHGRRLGFADVFAAPTPRQLAIRLADDEASSGHELARVFTLRRGDSSSPPIFTLPPAGGLGWCYTSLLAHVPAHIGVHALQAEGMDGHGAEPAATLEGWAARMLADIVATVGDGPFHLLGWSVGGMAAHAVAALAEREARPVGVIAMLDAYPAHQWKRLPEPDTSEALRGLLRIAGVEQELGEGEHLDHSRVVQILHEAGSALAAMPAPTLEASSRMVVRSARMIRAVNHEPIDHDLLFFAAGAPRAEDWLDPQEWAPFFRGRLDVQVLPASHGDLVREPHISVIGHRLTEAIERWS